MDNRCVQLFLFVFTKIVLSLHDLLLMCDNIACDAIDSQLFVQPRV